MYIKYENLAASEDNHSHLYSAAVYYKSKISLELEAGLCHQWFKGWSYLQH